MSATGTMRRAVRSQRLRADPRGARVARRAHRLGVAAATTMLAVDGVLLGWALTLVR